MGQNVEVKKKKDASEQRGFTVQQRQGASKASRAIVRK